MGTDVLRRESRKGGFVADLSTICRTRDIDAIAAATLRTGPRMADFRLSASKFLILAAGLIFWTGCQEQSVVHDLPSANFNGPIARAPSPPPVQPIKPIRPIPAPTHPKPAPQLSVPREWIPYAKANRWNWIVIHHSATPSGGAKAFDRMHREKGWDELGYHFVIGNGTDTADGQIEVGPRWPKQKHGAHAKTPDNQFNEHGIGICLVGNFDTQRPTRAQLASLARLVAYLMQTYHIPADRVIGHCDTKATDCPGRNLHVAEVRRMAVRLAAGKDPGGRSIQTASGR